MLQDCEISLCWDNSHDTTAKEVTYDVRVFRDSKPEPYSQRTAEQEEADTQRVERMAKVAEVDGGERTADEKAARVSPPPPPPGQALEYCKVLSSSGREHYPAPTPTTTQPPEDDEVDFMDPEEIYRAEIRRKKIIETAMLKEMCEQHKLATDGGRHDFIDR